jgi:CubicO group peptidase (beta-lactamase class C family)
MAKVIRYILLILLVLPCAGCAQKASINKNLPELISNTHLYFSEAPIIKEDIHSFLISKKGQIINQYYYNGFTQDSLNNVKSITKSIVGLLIGIAIDQQLIKDIHQPIIDYFDDCNDHSGFSEKSEITIEHLLMMQSGIQWNNRASIKDQWWFHENPNCFFLNHFPMDTSTSAGVRFSYNSAVAHLLSGIISRVSGMSTKQFADKYLFKPLGIKDYFWEHDRAGEYRGNSELYLLPKDMLKIGNLLLNNGTYQGKSILSNSWIMRTLESAYDATPLMNYGYLWMTSKDKSPFFFFAGGSGGHHIFIVPNYHLVIVTTGHWNNARSTQEIMAACVERIIKPLEH